MMVFVGERSIALGIEVAGIYKQAASKKDYHEVSATSPELWCSPYRR